MRAWAKAGQPMRDFWSCSPAQFNATLEAHSPKQAKRKGSAAELMGLARLHPGFSGEIRDGEAPD